MKKAAPDNFRYDLAISREQSNSKGEKMYIQTRMAEYADELWELLKKDNTFVYMCGLKGMEKGIDDIMTSLAARDGMFSSSLFGIALIHSYKKFRFHPPSNIMEWISSF